MKTTLRVVLLLVVGFVAVVLVRTWTFASLQPQVAAVEPVVLDDAGALERFAKSLTFRTVTLQDGTEDRGEFLKLHAFLRASFPAVHESLQVEPVNELSRLYTWTGTEPQLDPIVLMGHLDVVAVSPGSEADWSPRFLDSGLRRNDGCVPESRVRN